MLFDKKITSNNTIRKFPSEMFPYPAPLYDLETFEFLISGRTYDHKNNQGLCYLWCVFKMVSLLSLLDMGRQLIAIFMANLDCRKLVRLYDGSVFDGPKLATLMLFNKYKVVGVNDYKSLTEVYDIINRKYTKDEMFIFAYTGTHWVLITSYGVLYDSIKRDKDYKYNFVKYTLYRCIRSKRKVKLS